MNEFYLDRHMDNKHLDQIPVSQSLPHTELETESYFLVQPNATVCLASLCPIFGCKKKRIPSDRSAISKIDGKISSKKFDFIIPCHQSEAEEVRKDCALISSRCPKLPTSNYS